jgi:hypothetical protein
MGLEFLLHPACEVGLVLFTAFLASGALAAAYVRHHRRPHALVTLAGGFGLLWLAHFAVSERHEPFVSAAGALVVALSHVVNRRLCASCPSHCHSPTDPAAK